MVVPGAGGLAYRSFQCPGRERRRTVPQSNVVARADVEFKRHGGVDDAHQQQNDTGNQQGFKPLPSFASTPLPIRYRSSIRFHCFSLLVLVRTTGKKTFRATLALGLVMAVSSFAGVRGSMESRPASERP